MKEAGDEIAILATGHFTHFDTVVTISGHVVKTTVLPHEMVFDT